MSSIDISRRHNLGSDVVLERIREIEPKLREKYGVGFEWNGSDASVRGKGVSGKVHISDSEISISLKLGLLLRPLASKIRDAMEGAIEKALAG